LALSIISDKRDAGNTVVGILSAAPLVRFGEMIAAALTSLPAPHPGDRSLVPFSRHDHVRGQPPDWNSSRCELVEAEQRLHPLKTVQSPACPAKDPGPNSAIDALTRISHTPKLGVARALMPNTT
jgi:hypothetical protein